MVKTKLQNLLTKDDLDVVRPLVRDVDGGARVWVRAKPGARRDQLALVDDKLTLSVTAPPVDGKANDGIRQGFAAAVDVRQKEVRIHTGEKARDKELHVDDLTADQLARRLCRS